MIYLLVAFWLWLYQIFCICQYPIFKFNKKIFIPDFPFVFFVIILIVNRLCLYRNNYHLYFVKNKSREYFIPTALYYQYRYFRVIFLSWYFALVVYAVIALIPLLSFSHFRCLASKSFHSRYFSQLPWHPAQRDSQPLQGQITRSIINASISNLQVYNTPKCL